MHKNKILMGVHLKEKYQNLVISKSWKKSEKIGKKVVWQLHWTFAIEKWLVIKDWGGKIWSKDKYFEW